MKARFTILIFLFVSTQLWAQVTVTVDATATPTAISKYIYGRNNSLSGNPGSSFTIDWTRLKAAGVNMMRESGGNNSTKYNWKRKISSHPDWYNNVYSNDWSAAAVALQQNMPSAHGMWAFQLLGKAAMTDAANFGDYSFNGSQWWNGVNQNLAGGGQPNPSTWAAVTNPSTASNKAAKEGDINLYLEDWTADSTTSILDHWFTDLSLNKENFKYWNMDNEVEIWSGTHDDAMPTQLAAEDFMQKYFAVAKMARAKYPDIKLVGPVTANEWQWYNWNGNVINVGGTNYAWIEYFIKRVGEEEAATGIRLLDVVDIHFYPGSTDVSQVVQMHRVYFDETYDFPEANGLKKINGGYDNSLTKEYIFGRIKTWLDKYLPANHGVTLGVTETGVNITNTNGIAVWYASTLGEFMKHPEVEMFTPWTWSVGMWETLHLYSRYNKPTFIPATSTDETNVSGYPSINATGDSITIMLVNRSTTASKTVNVGFKGFTLDAGSFATLKLSGLTSTETFNSHTSNALKKSTVTATGNAVSVSLPALSIMAVQFKGVKSEYVTATEEELDFKLLEAFPNPTLSASNLHITINQPGQAALELLNTNGQVVQDIFQGEIKSVPFNKDVEVSKLSKGVYFLRLNLDGKILVRKVLTY
ncbi:MAG TPA: glycoside hydrolase family 44 protein [Cyclobacteriaceae bacterium]